MTQINSNTRKRGQNINHFIIKLQKLSPLDLDLLMNVTHLYNRYLEFKAVSGCRKSIIFGRTTLNLNAVFVRRSLNQTATYFNFRLPIDQGMVLFDALQFWLSNPNGKDLYSYNDDLRCQGISDIVFEQLPVNTQISINGSLAYNRVTNSSSAAITD